MKIEKLNVEKALQSGWKEWKKYGKNRLYFNIEESELVDLGFYKSGRVSFSEFKGEKISHSEGEKLAGAKIFIDLDTNELSVESCADEDIMDEIVKNAVKKIVDPDDEEETEEEETEPMKKVEFSKVSDKEAEVLVDGDTYGTLKFGGEEFGTQKNIWILWPNNIDDAVSYFSDLKETEEAISDELNGL